MNKQTQSRWFTFVLELVEIYNKELDWEGRGVTLHFSTLDEAKANIRERLTSYDGDNHVIAHIGREEYDQHWQCWNHPEGDYEMAVAMLDGNGEMFFWNEGKGL